MPEKKKLFLGFEVGTGKQVFIPYFHMLVAGQTQRSGKTSSVKTLAKQAVVEGYKILVFDTKSNMVEFSDFGQEIPICLRETTDALTLLGLLESVMGRRLPAQYLAALSRLTNNASNFRKVLENAEVMERKSGSPFVKDVCRNIIELLTRLIQQTAGQNTSSSLELLYPISRITMNKFALEAQQMIIKTAFEDAIINYQKVIIILDESSKFIPQKHRSACERAINHYVTQGAITENYLWLATQYLATTNKDPIKAMDVKLLGRQSEFNECKHSLEVIPKTELKITNDTIMNLKLGHFIVISEEEVKIVYVCVENADYTESQQVALGKRAPQDIHYRFSKLLTEDEVKALNKAHADDQVITIEVPPKPETPLPPPVPPPKPVETAQKKLTSTPKTTKTLPQQVVPVTKEPLILDEKIKRLEQHLEDLRRKVQLIEDVVTAPPEGKLEVRKKLIKIKPIQTFEFTTTETDIGKLLYLAKEHFFDVEHPLREVVEEIERRHWTVSSSNSIRESLMRLVEKQVIATRRNARQDFLYSLCPNVIFTEEEGKQDA